MITEYFENIFKQENVDEIPVRPQKLEKPITPKEIKDAIKKLKNNKSASTSATTPSSGGASRT